MSISGKGDLITGAGRTIARETALRLATAGAHVAIADVSKRDNIFAAVDHAEKKLGGFDILVNNAGIAQVQPLADATPEHVLHF